MKNMKNCPLLCAAAVSMLLVTLLGWGIRSDAYNKGNNDSTEVKEQWVMEPAVQEVMQRASEGKFPWIYKKAKPVLPMKKPALEFNTEYEVLETETLAENSIANTEFETETEPVYTTYSFTEVTPDYFDDALFIGDSRTVGLGEYSGFDNAAFYASVGLTVYDMFTNPIVEEDGNKITIEQALAEHQFGKIYLMIGINEMGTGTIDSFMESYNAAVAHIRELQPDALIFVEGIMYVKQEKSETDKIFNNPAIAARNDRIAMLANNHDIFYIDVNEVVTDATGNLNPDYSYDDVHLLGKYYSVWADFLLKHGIVKE